ncbi:MAG: hypothetical protein QMD00_03115 [Hadesarchaea archaeon]|nr:hypothetical protein [Hadesarchaea archaeon]
MLDVLGYVLLGLILIMAPGFLFSLILYPRLGDLDFWTRMGVSLALGTLVASYIGFAIAKAGVLQLGPFVGVDLALCVVFLPFVYFRGGFGVIMRYTRAVLGIFQKFKLPKPSKLPTPPPEQPKPPEQPQPEQPKEQPKEQPPERGGSC